MCAALGRADVISEEGAVGEVKKETLAPTDKFIHLLQAIHRNIVT